MTRTPTKTKNAVWSWSRPNAAPRFSTYVRRRKSPTTGTGTDRTPLRSRRSSAMRLVIWSTTTTSAARPRNSRPRSGKVTSFRGASTAGTMSATGSVTVGFAPDGDHDRMTVDLVFGCVPAIDGLEAGLQARRECFAADVRGVLLE